MADEIILLVALPLLGGAVALASAGAERVAGGAHGAGDDNRTARPHRAARLVRVAQLLSVALLAAGLGYLVFLSAPVRSGEVITYALGGFSAPVGIELRLDGLSWVISLLVYTVSFLVALFALADRSYRSEFYLFYMLLVAGMVGVVLTTDLFNLFVSFEIVAMAAYVLIAYHRDAPALVAAFKYLVLSSVGILFFLIGTFVIYRELGTLSLADIAAAGATGQPLDLALVALVVGIGVRTAFIPFHTWLPEAHAYAPHPISAVLSGVLIKVSFFAMVRIVWAIDAALFAELLLWIGAVTALVAVVWALSQRDAKKLLAYHSISQMGYVLAAFGAALVAGAGAAGSAAAAGAAAGPGAAAAIGAAATGAGTAGSAAAAGAAAGSGAALAASVYHAINHGLFKSLLFLAVGYAVVLTGARDVYRMQPLGRRAPLLAVFFFVGAFSIAGIPGFNGYASKLAVSAALEGSPAYVLLWLTGVGTVASFLKLSRVFLPAARGSTDGEAKPDSEVAAAAGAAPAAAAMLVLAVLCVVTGVAPGRTLGVLHGLLAPGAAAIGGAGSAVGAAVEAAGLSDGAFTVAKLADTAVTVALGVVLFLTVRTQAGRKMTSRVEAVAPGLRAVLLFFFGGFVGFAAIALLS